MRVLVVEPDGSDRWEEVPEGDDQLTGLSNLLGGYVEQVNRQSMFDAGVCMLVDEEGLLKHKSLNERAQRMSTYPGDIVGTAVFVGFKRDPIEGDSWSDCPKDVRVLL